MLSTRNTEKNKTTFPFFRRLQSVKEDWLITHIQNSMTCVLIVVEMPGALGAQKC